MVKNKSLNEREAPDNQVTPGYTPSGEGLWSIHAAKGHAVDTKTRDRSNRDYWSRLDVLINHERKVVARLERRAAEARGTPKFNPICGALQKTRYFLRRLEAQQRHMLGQVRQGGPGDS